MLAIIHRLHSTATISDNAKRIMILSMLVFAALC